MRKKSQKRFKEEHSKSDGRFFFQTQEGGQNKHNNLLFFYVENQLFCGGGQTFFTYTIFLPHKFLTQLTFFDDDTIPYNMTHSIW